MSARPGSSGSSGLATMLRLTLRVGLVLLRVLVEALRFVLRIALDLLDALSRLLKVAVILILLAIPQSTAASEGRQIAVIIDTSGSMTGSDPQRYTVQLTQILGDLLASGDVLTVSWMPDNGSCSDQASSAYALRLDPTRRSEFKRRLDEVIQYDGNNEFAVPTRVAIRALQGGSGSAGGARRGRLLLVIADSGGMGSCRAELTTELQALRRSGALIAAVNMGGSGAFDSNPAFELARGAGNAQQLVEAVAEVYQRLLGAKKVRTGSVQGGLVEAPIAPHVTEAYLVVAADGQVGAVAEGVGNPGAAGMDTDYRGGGQTRGLDGVVRGYRIVKLDRPAAGTWRFELPGVEGQAGWMLIQDFSRIGVRLVSSPEVIEGRPSLLEVELVDEDTGERITDLATRPGFEMTVKLDDQTYRLVDDGSGRDRQAGDGVFSAVVEAEGAGERTLEVGVEDELLDLGLSVTTRVVSVMWDSTITTPDKVPVGEPVQLAVVAAPVTSNGSVRPPDRYEVDTGRSTVELRPAQEKVCAGDGVGLSPGARCYAASWVPHQLGTYHLDFVPAGGDPAVSASAEIVVIGVLRLGQAAPVQLGTVTGGEVAEASLDLEQATVRGSHEVKLSSDLDTSRCRLWVDTGAGWVPVGSRPVEATIADADGLSWPVRLEVGRCPRGCQPGDAGSIRVEGTAPGGAAVTVQAALNVTIVPEPWLRCWWPWLAAGFALLLAGIVVHGYWSPSRFQRRMGVVLSPEPDMDEGVFLLIRRTRGGGAGFYRDAKVFVCDDFRLSGKPSGAVARLRAHRKQVRLVPAPGAGLLRRSADDTWEPVPASETVMRTGVMYRNELGTLYFELGRG